MKFLAIEQDPAVEIRYVHIGRNDIPLTVQGSVTKFVTDRRTGIQYWVDGVNELVGESLVQLGEQGSFPTVDSLRFTLQTIAAHLLEREI